jgi:hypothetical protein
VRAFGWYTPYTLKKMQLSTREPNL